MKQAMSRSLIHARVGDEYWVCGLAHKVWGLADLYVALRVKVVSASGISALLAAGMVEHVRAESYWVQA